MASSSSGLVANWLLNDEGAGTATTVADATGNHNGTASGATWTTDGPDVYQHQVHSDGEGADTLISIESIRGSEFGDTLTGSDADNTLRGRGGDDTITGGAGNDVLRGGAGADTYVWALGDGYDIVQANQDDTGDDVIQITGGSFYGINWGFDSDHLYVGAAVNPGDDFDDVGGSIRLQNFRSGSDSVDYVTVDSDLDSFYTADGSDTRLYLTSGIEGEDQGIYTELLIGTDGDDVIHGGAGIGDGADDGGGTGGFRDYLYGAGGDDVIHGADDTKDALFGGDGDDVLYGYAGDDRLEGQGGNDFIDGGAGTDEVRYDNAGTESQTIDLSKQGQAYDGALRFGGSGVYVDVGENGSALNFTSSFTAEAWINPSSLSFDNGHGTIVANYTDTDEGYILRVTSGGNVQLHLANAATAGNKFWEFDANVTTGDWTHIAAVFDDTANTVNVYQDGQVLSVVQVAGSQSTNAYTDTLHASTGPFYIGATKVTAGSTQHFIGDMADVRMWSVARTQPEVFADMTAPVPSDTPNLVANWPLNDADSGAATTVADAKGSLDGTAVGGPVWQATGPDILEHQFVGTTEGYDTLLNIENVRGGDGADTIVGSDGVNFLRGRAGDDTITGGAGDDVLRGEAGDDTYIWATGDGYDVVQANGDSGGGDVIKFEGSFYDWRVDWDANDLFIGAVQSDYNASTVGGNITLQDFRNGADSIDYVELSTAFDYFYTNQGGNTRVYLTSGIVGEDQGGYTELVIGTNAAETLHGGAGVGDGTDDGGGTGGFKDYIWGLGGDDILHGADDTADNLYGGAGDDVHYGYDGDDRFRGGAGDDTMYGGDGSDMIRYDSGDEDGGLGVYVNLSDTVRDSVAAGTATDTHGDTDTLDSIEDARLSDQDDTFIGNDADNTVRANAGDDVLEGGAGNDVLRGGAGADTYVWNLGDGFDTVEANQDDNGLDVIEIQGGSFYAVNWSWDADHLYVGAAVNPGDDFEDVGGSVRLKNFRSGSDSVAYVTLDSTLDYFYTQDGSDTRLYLTSGIAGDDQGIYTELLIGTEVDDVIHGGAGVGDGTDDGGGTGGFRDYLYGAGGNDTIHGADDTKDQLFGGDGNDTLYGYDGDDRLEGGMGNDTIDGGDGIDEVRYDNYDETQTIDLRNTGAQTIGASEGTDTLLNIENVRGGSGSDTIHGTDADANRLRGRGGDDFLFGHGGDDDLRGESGSDVLFGGDGDDTLTGGSGNDHIFGDDGTDVAVFSGNAADYTIITDVDALNVTVVGGDGLDVLEGIETLRFDDGDVAVNFEPIVEGVDEQGTFLQFDGVDDVASIAHASSLDFGTSNFTIEATIKLDDLPSGSNPYIIFDKRDATNGVALAVDQFGRLNLLANPVTSLNSTSGDIVAGTWHHVAVSVDRSGNAQLYVDGEASNSVDISGQSATSLGNAADVLIGNGESGDVGIQGAPLHGSIAELRVWNAALNAEQIDDGTGHTIDDAGFVSNLVGYWTFDDAATGTARDLSGYGNDAVVADGPPINPFQPYLSLDGDSQGIDVGDPSDLAVTGDLTLEASVRLDAIPTGVVALISKIEASGAIDGQYRLAAYGSTSTSDGAVTGLANTLVFKAILSDSTQVVAPSGITIQAGTWHSYAAAFDADTATVTFFQDGVQVGSPIALQDVSDASTVTGPVTLNGDASDFNIGSSENSTDTANSFLNGSIAEVRVWDKTLTATEVAQTTAGNVDVSDTNLKGYWKIAEGSGSTVNDLTANGNNGTIEDGGSTLGSPDWTTGATAALPVPVDRAIDLDGADTEYLTGGNADLAIAGDLTVEAWIRPDNLTPVSSHIVNFGVDSGSDSVEANNTLYSLEVLSSGALRLFHETTGGANVTYTTAAGVVTPGEWAHISAVRSGGGTGVNPDVELYVNGRALTVTVDEQNSVAGAPVGGANGQLYVGHLDLDPDYDGQIADLRIWNTARSQAEVIQGMAGPVPSDSQGLVSNWAMNEAASGDVTTVADGAGTATLTATGEGTPTSPQFVTVAAPIEADRGRGIVDDFADAAVDTNTWTIVDNDSNSTHAESAGAIQLTNRARLVSNDEFKPTIEDPVIVTLSGRLDATADGFNVALRSDGLDTSHDGFDNGILVTFTDGELLYVRKWVEGSLTNIASAVPTTGITIDPNVDYQVRVTDDGDTIVATISDGTSSFTHTVSDDTEFAVNKVAVYNANYAAMDRTLSLSDIAVTQGGTPVVLAEDTEYRGTLAAEDLEDDDITYGVAIGGEPENGTLSIDSATGEIVYTPFDDFVGADSFRVTATDENGNTEPHTIHVFVQGRQDAPEGHATLSTGALVFDGSDTVTVADAPELNPTAGLTVESWVRFDQASGVFNVAGKENEDSAVYEGWRVLVSSGKLQLIVTDEDGRSFTATADQAFAAAGSDWHHIAVSYDQVQPQLYVDGAPVTFTTTFAGGATDTVNMLVPTNGHDLALGYSPRAAASDFVGTMDEVRIWDGARTADQIADNYDNLIENPGSDTSLLGYWNFDGTDVDETTGTVVDQSGYANTAVMGGSAVGDAAEPTHIVSPVHVLEFDGSTTKVEIEQDSAINIGTEDFTFETWVEFDTASGTDALFDWREAATVTDGAVLHRSTAGGLAFTIYGDTGITIESAGGLFAANVLYHVSASADRDGDAVLYINGEEVARGDISAADGFNVTPQNNPLTLGNVSSGVTTSVTALEGLMYNARLWDKALSEAEVNAEPGPVQIDSPNLIGNWLLDEGAGTNAIDVSGNDNNGAITGASWRDAAPVLLGDAIDVQEGRVIHGQLVADDIDGAGGTFTFALVGEPAHGTVEIQSNGQFAYIPGDSDSSDQDSFTYTVTDSRGLTGDPQTVTINVAAQNDPPESVGALVSTGSFQFDGEDDVITVGHDFDYANTFTLEAWIKPDALPVSSTDTIIGHGRADPQTADGFALRLGEDGGLAFTAWNVKDYTVSGAEITSVLGSAITADTWQHVAVTMDANNDVTFYVGGEKIATVEGSAPAGTSPQQPLTIGGRVNELDTNEHFEGEITQVRIWSEVRSDRQIGENYARLIPEDADALEAAYTGEIVDGDVVNYAEGADFDASAHVRRSLEFDGVDDRIVVSNAADLNVGSGSLTVEAWFYYDGEGTNAYLVNKGNDTSSTVAGYSIHGSIANSGQDYNLVVRAGNGSEAGQQVFQMNGNDPIDVGWHHVALVIDQDGDEGVVTGYLDGSNVGWVNGGTGNTFTKTAIEPSADLIIGDNATLTGHDYEGPMADVRIWNHARTEDEIRDNMTADLTGLETGLVAGWALDEGLGAKAYDVTGDHTGTISGQSAGQEDWNVPALVGADPAVTAGAAQVTANYLSFDGSDDVVSVADNSDFEQAEMTVEAWFRADPTPVHSSNQRIVGKAEGSGDSYSIFLNASGELSFVGKSTVISNASTDLRDGEWHHVSATFETGANGAMTLYLDGEQVASGTHTTAMSFDTTPLLIGDFDGTGGVQQNFKGDIADVRVWNTIRGADEIVDGMRGYVDRETEGLVANWKLADGEGVNAHDFVGNNTGTLTNFPGDGSEWTNGAPIQVPDFTNVAFVSDGGQIAVGDVYDSGQTGQTFEGWFEIDGGSSLLWAKGGAGTGAGYQLAYDGSGLAFNVADGTDNYTISAGTGTLTGWHHIATVIDPFSGDTRIYLDGKLQPTSASGTQASFNSIGSLETTANLVIASSLNGRVANVRIWDDVLDDADIANNMTATLTRDEHDLIAFWPMNEAEGTTAHNVVEESTDATISGGSWAMVAPTVGANEFGVAEYVMTEGSLLYSRILTEDVEGDTLTYTVIGEPRTGEVNVATDGTFSYERAYDIPGVDSFTVRIEDGNGGVEEQTIRIRMTDRAGDDAPLAATEFDSGLVMSFSGSELISTAASGASGNFTTEAWIKAYPDQGEQANNAVIWSMSGGSNNFAVNLLQQGGKLLLQAINTSSGQELISETTGNALDGAWHHVAVVKEDASTLALYVDGDIQGSVTGSFGNSTTSFQMGSSSDGFAGQMDEVRIWGVERTGEEIRADMNQQVSADTAGLAHLYRFDEAGTIARDLVGGANSGTVDEERFVEPAVVVGANRTSAMAFDGSTGYVDVASGPGSLTDFTLETWVKMDEVPSSGVVALFATDDSTNPLHLNLNNGQVQLGVAGGSPAFGTSLSSYVGQWVHIAVTYDQDGGDFNGTLYLNGDEVDAVTLGSHTPSVTDYTIGAWNSGGSVQRFINGQLDDVRLWDTVRTPEEIEANYQEQIDRAYAEEHLAANWTFEATQAAVIDVTANGHDGGAIGGAHRVYLPSQLPIERPLAALEFSGGEKVEISDNAALDFATNQAFSIDAWIRPDDLDTDQTIVLKGDGGINYAFKVDTDGNLVLYSDDQTVTSSGEATVEAGVWNHVAVTYDGTTAEFFLNGDSIGTATGYANAAANTGDLNIGLNPTETEGFDGLIADVRLWGTDLTAPEIQGVMTRPDYDNESVIGTWRLDEGGSSRAFDSSGHGLTSQAFQPGVEPSWVAGESPPIVGRSSELVFDGNSTYLEFDDALVPEGEDNPFAIQGDLTVEMWITPEDKSFDQALFAFAAAGETEAANAQYFAYLDTDGNIVYTHEYGAGLNVAATWDTGLTFGEPVHIALSRNDANGTVDLYVNGVRQTKSAFNEGGTGTDNGSSILTANEYENSAAGGEDGALVFGVNPTVGTGLQNYFQGTMSDIRVWNAARSQAEIEGGMARQLTGPEDGLVGYWRLQDGVGNTAQDFTFQGYELDVSGAVHWQDPTTGFAVPATGTAMGRITAEDFDGDTITFDLVGRHADGGEFRVNSFATGGQTTSHVAQLADGGYVVVWHSFGQDAASTLGIYAQRFDAAGAPIGGEIPVNTTTSGEQSAPVVAAMNDGGFAIAWEDDANGGDVKMRIFDFFGQAGSEITVNTTTANAQSAPDITVLNNDNIVVAWQSDPGGTDKDEFVTRTFLPSGSAAGGESASGSSLLVGNIEPSVTALSDGDYVVVWVEDASAGFAVKAERFNADGTSDSGEITVAAALLAGAGNPTATALPDGGFAVAWDTFGLLGSNSSIGLAVFNDSDQQVGSTVAVNTDTDGDNTDPQITALADGRFVVVWQDDGGADGDGGGVFGQIYGSSGSAVGSNFIISETVAGTQSLPAIAPTLDGGFLATWTSPDVDANGVFARKFDDQGNPVDAHSAQTAAGIVTLDPDTGVYTYAGDSAYSGSDSFTVKITDSEGNVAYETVQLDVLTSVDWQTDQGATWSAALVAGTVVVDSVTGDGLTALPGSDVALNVIGANASTVIDASIEIGAFNLVDADVTIDSGVTVEVGHAGEIASGNTLTLNGTLSGAGEWIVDGTVVMEPDSTIGAGAPMTFAADDGFSFGESAALAQSGTRTINRDVVLTGNNTLYRSNSGTPGFVIAGTGSITNTAILATVGNNNEINVGFTNDVEGTFDLNGASAGQTTLTFGASFDNLGLIHITGDGTGDVTVELGDVLFSEGTIRIDGTGDLFRVRGSVINRGTLDADRDIRFTETASDTGGFDGRSSTIDIASGATVELGLVTDHNFDISMGDTVISGPGALRVQAGAGSSLVLDGDVTIGSGAELDITNGPDITGSGTITIESGASFTMTTNVIGSDITVVNEGDLNLSLNAEFQGTLVNESSGTITVTEQGTPNRTIDVAENFVNNGTVTWSTDDSFDTTMTFAIGEGDGVFTNAEGGTIQFAGDDGDSRVINAHLVNHGLLDVAASATVTTDAGMIENYGTIQIASGATLVLDDSDTGATALDFTNYAGGLLTGEGTLDVSGLNGGGFTNAGTINAGGEDPAGDLSVQGNLTSTETAEYEFDIEDLGTYDTLSVSGTFGMSGTLNAEFAGNFMLFSGDEDTEFMLLSATGGLSGAFASIEGLDQQSGWVLDPTRDATSMSLTARATTESGSGGDNTFDSSAQGTADYIQGGLGDDFFDLNGGGDVLFGQGGNDTFQLHASDDFHFLDGGDGIDWLRLEVSIDMAGFENDLIQRIEAISLESNADLTLGIGDVLGMTEGTNLLTGEEDSLVVRLDDASSGVILSDDTDWTEVDSDARLDADQDGNDESYSVQQHSSGAKIYIENTDGGG